MSYTSHSIARVMNLSEQTARRVLAEVFPNRDEPLDWRLTDEEYCDVLRHLMHNKKRQYGGTQKRKRKYVRKITHAVSDLGLF